MKLKRALRYFAAPFFFAVLFVVPCLPRSYYSCLEQELQPELEDAAQVGTVRLQETVAQAGGIACGIVRSAVAGGGGIHSRPLSVVENVEALGAELHGDGFVDGEILEQSHVEIEAVGVVQRISSGVSEGQSLRLCVGRWI